MNHQGGIDKEQWLVGSVLPTPSWQKGLQARGALTEKQYQNTLNTVAHGFRERMGIALDRMTDSHAAMLQKRTLRAGREEMRRTLGDRLDYLRKNQAAPKKQNEFIGRVRDDVMKRLKTLLGPKFSDSRYDIQILSASQTLLDFLGGVDCFVDLVESKEDKTVPLASCMIDVKSVNEKGRRRDEDKMTDIFFFYHPAYITRDSISPGLFSSADYQEFVDRVAYFLTERVRYSHRF